MIMEGSSPEANGPVDRALPVGSRQEGGRIVRIATALGTYVVEIVNDLGPIADPLTAEVERAVIECLRVHRHLAGEMVTVEIQRGSLDYRVLDL
jgi:hypothetical protein